ncbi:MAG: GyrI-like domain-containing protein, partial [Candidatus Bathyarchaeota archaeon]
MSETYQVKVLPVQLTVTIRTRSTVQDLPHTIGEAYHAIIAYLNELGEQPTGTPFVIYYNLDMDALDVEIGFPVLKPISDKGRIRSSHIAAGRYATTIHTGPYTEMEPVYDGLTNWMQKLGYEAAGPAIEYYRNDPNEVGMNNAQTEIRLPL